MIDKGPVKHSVMPPQKPNWANALRLVNLSCGT